MEIVPSTPSHCRWQSFVEAVVLQLIAVGLITADNLNAAAQVKLKLLVNFLLSFSPSFKIWIASDNCINDDQNCAWETFLKHLGTDASWSTVEADVLLRALAQMFPGAEFFVRCTSNPGKPLKYVLLLQALVTTMHWR